MAGPNEGIEARAGHRSALAIAALELAAAGHPLIPLHTPSASGGCSCGRRCGSPGKHPRGVLGLRSASADLERVEAWWWAQPEANIGLRCDGLAVFDVDGPEGERSPSREWYGALDGAGLARRGPYHLRHTFATEALAAGISIFELSRLMGTSVAMIDRTYGHLARDSEDTIRVRLNARTGRDGVVMASEPERD